MENVIEGKKNRLMASILVAALLLCGTYAEAAKKKLYMNMGSTSSSSSHYLYATALAKVLNTQVPEVSITVVVTGASWDNVSRMKRDELQMASITAYDVSYQVYNGIGAAQGQKPFDVLRAMPSYTFSITYTVVREDSGIKDIRDLTGKKFSAGIAGSSTETGTRNIMEINGIKPDWRPGSTGEAIAAIKNREWVGYQKGAVGYQLDSSMLEIKAQSPIRLLSFTPEMREKAKRAFPWYLWAIAFPGTIRDYPSESDIINWGYAVGTLVKKDLVDQELGYKMAKAIIENWNDQVTAFKASKDFNPINDTIKYWSEYDKPVPLHSGFVQYCLEKGVKVPSNLIPSEFTQK